MSLPAEARAPETIVVCHKQARALDDNGEQITVQGWFDNLTEIADLTDQRILLRYLPQSTADREAATHGFLLDPHDSRSPVLLPLPISPDRYRLAKQYFDLALWPWLHENQADLQLALDDGPGLGRLECEYFRLNAETARALLRESPTGSTVMLHDLHFGLVPGMLTGAIGVEEFARQAELEARRGYAAAEALTALGDEITAGRQTVALNLAGMIHTAVPRPAAWNRLPDPMRSLLTASLHSVPWGVHDARWAENLGRAGGDERRGTQLVTPIGVSSDPLRAEARGGMGTLPEVHRRIGDRDLVLVHGRVDPKNEIPVVLDAFGRLLARDPHAAVMVLQVAQARPGNPPYDRDWLKTLELVDELNARFGSPEAPVVIHYADNHRPRILALAMGDETHPGALVQISASQIGGFDQVGWEGLAMQPAGLVPVITRGPGAAPTLAPFAVVVDDIATLDEGIATALEQARELRDGPPGARRARAALVETALDRLNHRDWHHTLLGAARANEMLFRFLAQPTSVVVDPVLQDRNEWAASLAKLPSPTIRSVDRSTLGLG